MSDTTIESFPESSPTPFLDRRKTGTFIGDTLRYAGQVSQFGLSDWLAYIAWVGMMLGLLGGTSGFLLIGWYHGVTYPAYVWNVPIGIAIFVGAISFDTIGHRTAYKIALQRGEALVHHITIFAGVSSCVLLGLAYTYPVFLRFPAWSFTILSIFYAVIDESMHWFRYYQGNSDRVEMWSHFFIFVGHLIFILPWVYWFEVGYPGVAQTIPYLPHLW